MGYANAHINMKNFRKELIFLKKAKSPSLILFPVLSWFGLWAAINTGPWNLGGLLLGGMNTINALRAILPLSILLIGSLQIISTSAVQRSRMTPPEALFWVYGIAMLVASIQVSPWFPTAYWGFSFLAALLGTRLFLTSKNLLKNITLLNQLTWAISTVILLMLVLFARDTLFSNGTGYGIVNRTGDVAGGAMSRSSGMARFAAIPAIFSFVAFWRIRNIFVWFLAISIFAGSISLIWFMQSRGAIFSLIFALAFIMLFMGRVSRYIAIALLVVGMLGNTALFFGFADSFVFNHLTRGTGLEGFKDMSGRDYIWRLAMDAIEEQPLLGYGPQADRRILFFNAQNGAIYAMLCGGIIGLFGFIGGMFAAWWAFAKIQFGRFKLTTKQHDMLIMTGGMLAFFTLRSYPENTAALFSVDLLVQLPAMLYIFILYRVLKANKKRFQLITPP